MGRGGYLYKLQPLRPFQLSGVTATEGRPPDGQREAPAATRFAAAEFGSAWVMDPRTRRSDSTAWLPQAGHP